MQNPIPTPASAIRAAIRSATLAATLTTAFATPLLAQGVPGEVLAEQRVSNTAGGLPAGTFTSVAQFGASAASLGDLDGNGVDDLAVGAPLQDHGGDLVGAVHILFMEADGTVAGHREIGAGSGDFPAGTLEAGDEFGASLAAIGDVEGNGVVDILVGAPGDDDGNFDAGAAYSILLEADGSVKNFVKISATSGGFGGALGNFDRFGDSVASLGDLTGNGTVDYAVGTPDDDDEGTNSGAIWLLSTTPTGSIGAHVKLTEADLAPGFVPVAGDGFGFSLANIGDRDGNGIDDLAVGAPGRSYAHAEEGAVFLLMLSSSASVVQAKEISSVAGFFTGTLEEDAHFGSSVADIGDQDGDGVDDLAVGASDLFGETDRVFVLHLNSDLTVKAHVAIGDGSGGLIGPLDERDNFGSAVAARGDVDGDGRVDLLVGARDTNDGLFRSGAVHTLFLNSRVWEDRGHAMAGAGGEPELEGRGTMVGGEPVDLDLTGAAASAPAFLFIGFSELNAPLEGGILVPDLNPPGLLMVLVTDPSGEILLGSTWPAGVVSGLEMFFQYYVEDAGGPFGFAASNAIRGVTP